MIRLPEAQVHRAFDILHAEDHARARAAYEFAERQLKVTLAKAELIAQAKTAGERQAIAQASDDYARALGDFKLIAETYYLARDARDAASAVIDAWRTQQSDMRALGRVG